MDSLEILCTIMHVQSYGWSLSSVSQRGSAGPLGSPCGPFPNLLHKLLSQIGSTWRSVYQTSMTRFQQLPSLVEKVPHFPLGR